MKPRTKSALALGAIAIAICAACNPDGGRDRKNGVMYAPPRTNWIESGVLTLPEVKP